MTTIVIGSGYSGSGAVFEYLAGRPDVANPLKGEEFRLVQDSGGIVDLHHAIGPGFTVQKASASIREFAALCRRMGRPEGATPRGMNYGDIVPNYDHICAQYVEAITALSYPGQSASDAMRLSRWETIAARLQRKLYRRLGRPLNTGTMRFPVVESEFLAQTRKFLNVLLRGLSGSRPKVKVLNHGGSFWQPHSSTQYYGERRVVVVTRDPRDIHSELLTRGKSYPKKDVDLFCSWYQGAMERISATEWTAEEVLHIKFEEFVHEFDNEKNRLNKFLGLDPSTESTYQRSRSALNIGKYKQILNAQQIGVIEKRLAGYLQY